MSHAKLRKENNCLNCDAVVDGPYCKNCGQLNAEPKQTLWHLLTHFIEDITHFDGKFFSTMKSLIWRPGFLSAEYVKGRRTKYLDPVRMYLFISTLFLISFLWLNTSEKRISAHTDPEFVHLTDSFKNAHKSGNEGYLSAKIHGRKIQILVLDDLYVRGYQYYDSVQRSLPDSEKSTRLDRFFEKNMIATSNAYQEDPYNFFNKGVEIFWHSISKIFFISLPIFAFFLYLLYIRRRKEFYYVSHAIFALHFYSVVFLFWIVLNLIDNKYYSTGLSVFANNTMIFGCFAYLYFAMLRFYRQGWLKTFIKFLVLSIGISAILLIITFILLINSFFALGH